jgi:WXG100 family type VII secretion target
MVTGTAGGRCDHLPRRGVTDARLRPKRLRVGRLPATLVTRSDIAYALGAWMTTLVVDFEALDQLRTAIERSIEHAEQHLATLDRQIRQLANIWSGAAAEGFRRTIADWMSGRQDLQRQLDYLRTIVTTAHHNHASAVATNVAMWRV